MEISLREFEVQRKVSTCVFLFLSLCFTKARLIGALPIGVFVGVCVAEVYLVKEIVDLSGINLVK